MLLILKDNSLIQDLITKSDVSDVLDAVLLGDRLGLNECVKLIKSNDICSIGIVGNLLRQRLYGNIATFINNIILNYTNVCVTYCRFCAFYRAPGARDSYTLSQDEVVRRILVARENLGTTQVLIQGGHNPNLRLEYFEDVFRTIKKKCPQIAIHGLSTSEIDMIAKVEKSSTKEILARLKESGLDSLPGAGAEILDDEVKAEISPLKIRSNEWLRIMEEAHDLNIKSSATMMYGTVENEEQQARHLLKIAELQEKTGGFMSFIPWSFEPNNTEMQFQGTTQYAQGGLNLLRMIALSRIVYYGLIDHLQSSWLTNGIGMAQLALNYGADDFGGTLVGEEVVSSTGARSTELTSARIVSAIRQIGFEPAERDNFYHILRHF